MFNTAVTGSKDTGTLILEGDLTLPNSQTLKDAFLDVLKRFQEIIVRIGDVEDVDFSCFQVFCAAHKSAVNQDKSITVVPPEQEPSRSHFLRKLELSGLSAQVEDNDNGTEPLPGARGFILREDI